MSSPKYSPLFLRWLRSLDAPLKARLGLQASWHKALQASRRTPVSRKGSKETTRR